MATKTMKALHWSAERGSVKLIDVHAPEKPSSPNHVIMKVAYAGVCGSDLHVISGAYQGGSDVVMGHETSGVVIAIGNEVTSCRVGDKVVMKPNSHCGKCHFCLRGKINCCIPDGIHSSYGIWKSGGWAEYCEIVSDQVYVLPSSLSLKQGILCEPYSCIIHGLDRCGIITDDSQILLMGAGIIGLLWSCLLHYKGNRNVTVIEISKERRKMVSDMGLGFKVFHPDEVKEKMDNVQPELDGYDLIIDCTGSARAAEMAFNWLRRGATYNIFGVCAKTAEMKIHPAEFMLREITITGTMIDPFTYPRTIPMVQHMVERYLDYGKLGIKVYKMEESAQAFDDLKNAKVSKAVFEFGGEDIVMAQ